MKLKELNEAIASACGVRAQVVTSVQNETFRQVQAALDKGERVTIPEFGVFIAKDTAGEEGEAGKKVVRFRARTGEKKEGKEVSERKAERQKKRAEAKAASSSE